LDVLRHGGGTTAPQCAPVIKTDASAGVGRARSAGRVRAAWGHEVGELHHAAKFPVLMMADGDSGRAAASRHALWHWRRRAAGWRLPGAVHPAAADGGAGAIRPFTVLHPANSTSVQRQDCTRQGTYGW